MEVVVFNDKGVEVFEEKGEMVCKTPFPSMPLFFWGDDGTRYTQVCYSLNHTIQNSVHKQHNNNNK
jgi:acetoacetyl-CoA synthetase